MAIRIAIAQGSPETKATVESVKALHAAVDAQDHEGIKRLLQNPECYIKAKIDDKTILQKAQENNDVESIGLITAALDAIRVRAHEAPEMPAAASNSEESKADDMQPVAAGAGHQAAQHFVQMVDPKLIEQLAGSGAVLLGEASSSAIAAQSTSIVQSLVAKPGAPVKGD